MADTTGTGTSAKKNRRRNLRVNKRARDSDEDDQPTTAAATAAKTSSLPGNKTAMTFTTKASHAGEKKGFQGFESSGMEATARQDDATRTMEDVGVRKLGGAGHIGTGDAANAANAANVDANGESTEYRGMQNYTDYRSNFRNEAERAGANIHERKQQAGPARPSANYRMTVVVDYQPDVCKDYKETGFCGFGDTCKFLHDRSDYKAGWQLDKDWDAQQKERKEKEARLMMGEEEDGEENKADGGGGGGDGLPFACLVCKEPWASCADPVVTKCGHYFCETCALKQNTKTGKCFACGKSTRGIFNSATEIIKQFKQRDRAR